MRQPAATQVQTPKARTRKLLRAAILAIALAGCGREPAPAPPEPAPSGETRTLKLAAGAVTEAELAGGQRHFYPLALAAGQYAGLIVDQRGIDVVVSLYAAADRRLTTVDSPNGTWGPEPLPVVAESAAPLRLEVRSPSARAAPGRYAVIVEALAPATSRDRRRVAAERAFAEGERLRRRQDGKSLDAAIASYQQAVAALGALGERGRQADVLYGLGWAHFNRGEVPTAGEAYQQALATFRELGEELKIANTLNSLGIAVHVLGEPEKAVLLYSEALEIHRALGRQRGESYSLNNLGRAYDSLGKVEEALTCYDQARAVKRQLGESESIQLHNMGLLYLKLGKRQQAVEVLEQALSLLEAEGNTGQVAVTLTLLGRACRESGRPREGLAHLLRALPMVREAGDRREVAVTLNSLGWTYVSLGRLEEAEDAYAQVLTTSRRLGHRHSQAAALANLGWLRHRLGQPEAAVDAYSQALPLLAAVGDSRGEASALVGLARVERSRGELAAAQAAIERALERIEALRTAPRSPQLRSVFFASKQDAYSFYVDLLMDLHRRHPALGYDARALEASERARARSLLDLMAEAGADLRRGIEPGLRAREADLVRRLNAAQEHLLRLEEDGAEPDRLAAAEDELRRLLRLDERLQAEIRRASPRSAALTQPVPLRLREIQQQVLDPETLLLEYALGTERSFVWAVTPGSVTSCELPPRAVLEEAARRAHALLAASHRTLARGETALALVELSRLLLDPVADQLAGHPRLLVIADGALHYLPFGALPIPAAAPPSPTADGPAPGRPLVADHEVVTLPSASSLAELRQAFSGRLRPPAAVAVLADPVFDAADPRVGPRSRSQPPSDAGRQDGGAESGRFRRLPFTRAEATAILQLVPVGEGFAALDFAASRATLAKLRGYRILHFATHGFFDPEHPELSGIVLSTVDEKGQPRDGFLRAHEIYRMDLPAELVVLSACQTALGKVVRGEGLVGLTRSFMVAGARRVVVTLWPVEDSASAELMQLFYREMLGHGRGPAAALRQAQATLRQVPGREPPYYWAGFVLHGDWCAGPGRGTKPNRPRRIYSKMNPKL